jgi:hypothetical protein
LFRHGEARPPLELSVLPPAGGIYTAFYLRLPQLMRAGPTSLLLLAVLCCAPPQRCRHPSSTLQRPLGGALRPRWARLRVCRRRPC